MNPYGYVHNPLSWVDPYGLAGDDCDKLLKNKKTTYEGTSRRDALRQAKRDAGIPNSQHPSEISRVDLGDGYGGVVRNPNGTPVTTRQYHYVSKDGKKIIIQEHSLGHYNFDK
ncbi:MULTISPECIES: HNH/endonuclease VII fold putative polymorphic toxin [Xenorhabdus]|uniref:HNH/endonuclease VII fold putative polymorphic toxin n=1 Tax=Xenorhabdus griffiniae TaxID=351672 RepID=UPI001EED2F68|nr:HNH/endonuclease VII fold putative polymorphic toxin [Xenorhabdus griffiniae]